jgi:hypothetical protein
MRSTGCILLICAFGLLESCSYQTRGYNYGTHEDDFRVLSDWVSKHGFPRQEYVRQWVVRGGDPGHFADYQWYRGEYTDSCMGNVRISLSEKDEIEVNAFYDGCSGYKTVEDVCIPELVKGIEKFYAQQKKKP